MRCGPERRCLDTAAALGLWPVIDPALAELDVGDWPARGLSDLERDDPAGLHAWLTDPVAAPHGGESPQLPSPATSVLHRAEPRHHAHRRIAVAHSITGALSGSTTKQANVSNVWNSYPVTSCRPGRRCTGWCGGIGQPHGLRCLRAPPLGAAPTSCARTHPDSAVRS